MIFNRVVFQRVLSLSLFVASATATTITVGFEPPAYTAGANIDGQQGWSNAGLFDAVVSYDAAYDGTQSLRMSNGITSGTFGNQTFTPQISMPAGESSVAPNDQFFASWYFKSVTGTLQDGLGISVSPDNGAGARMSWVRMEDDADPNLGMNLQFYDTTATGAFVFHELATNLDRSVWHRVDLNVSFVDGPSNDVVQVFLDGTLLITGTSWEGFETAGPKLDGGGLGLAPVNSLLFRASGAPASATLGTGGFYIDDITITTTPEPGTVGLLLAGMGALVVVYRSSRKNARRS
jgi:hypothetical protein